MNSTSNPRPGRMARRNLTMACAACAVLLSTGVGAAVSAGPGERSAADASTQNRAAGKLSQARILFELNATARDAGIQMLLDGEGWESMRIYDIEGELLLRIRADGSVGDIGVTELFFESAEPSLADLPLRDLLAMFPEGDYPVVAETADGQTLTGTARLTHAIPGPARVLSPDPGGTTDVGSTEVRWRPTDRPGVKIDHYQVIVETDDDPLRIFSVDVSRGVREVAVPSTFLERGTDYKLEVITVARGHNQTITESTFSTR
jgi:hypothetical protein